ncbi:unnamed protein product [Bemisia tabaci]|uniref:C-factor n=1 Tax=Bemisia tabaci TaxID=7038 RepID=A0A9P0ADB0_BEMTA|nr:unnamed protein product [Bemisia tabaci]
MTEIYSVLITGASKGIGLEFVKQFLTNKSVKPHIIIATCRNPETATALQELKKSDKKVHILKLDVDHFEAYDKVVGEVKTIVKDKGLTLLINNAAICVPFSDTLEDVTPEKFISILTTNTVAPVMLTKALYPLLKLSAEKNSKETKGLSVSRAAVINISSIGASIERRKGPALWCYRESKAALNMSTRTMAIEFEKDGILVESFHPGVVDTDLLACPGGPPSEIDTATSVTGMISVMLQLTGKNKEGFPEYTGEILPF